ncbi:MAG TPA: DUF6687 family protein [Actinomycetota bacterium]|nr:DUF6687 family protein [Actinomycetota bacterium]
MRYVPYEEMGGEPNIVVDGTGTDGTVLVLSHWRGSGTPETLADDLSTQIAFHYLDRPEIHVAAEMVSNNHFDEDGLCGIYAIVHPEDAVRRREQLIAVARAGDFGVARDRDVARVSMTLMAFEDEERSPLPPETLSLPYEQFSGVLYRETLALLPRLLDDIEPWRHLWGDEDAHLSATLKAIHDGTISIEEHPEIDLAIVTVDGFDADPHEMAVNTSTDCFRVLTVGVDEPTFRLRYETWVDYRSRATMPRPEMKPLAVRLSDKDEIEWLAGSIGGLTPDTRPDGETALEPKQIVEIVTAYLAGS